MRISKSYNTYQQNSYPQWLYLESPQ